MMQDNGISCEIFVLKMHTELHLIAVQLASSNTF